MFLTLNLSRIVMNAEEVVGIVACHAWEMDGKHALLATEMESKPIPSLSEKRKSVITAT
jgi:hypothetical protein